MYLSLSCQYNYYTKQKYHKEFILFEIAYNMYTYVSLEEREKYIIRSSIQELFVLQTSMLLDS